MFGIFLLHTVAFVRKNIYGALLLAMFIISNTWTRNTVKTFVTSTSCTTGDKIYASSATTAEALRFIGYTCSIERATVITAATIAIISAEGGVVGGGVTPVVVPRFTATVVGRDSTTSAVC